MKYLLALSVALFLTACGDTTATKPEQSTHTPPQPTTHDSDITPPTSPTLK